MNCMRVQTCSIVASCFLGALLLGCGDDDNGGDGSNGGTGGTGGTSGTGGTGGDGGATDQGFLRVLHISPDAPAVDVFANDGDTPIVSDLSFEEGTSFVEVAPGTYDFDIAPAGMTANDSVLAVDDVEVEAGTYYTAVAFDELDNLQAEAIEEDFSSLADGEIRVRAAHGAVGVGEVDIWNLPESGSPELLVEDLDFGTATDPIDLPAGAYTLGIDVDDDASPDLTFELPELEAGSYASVFAVADGEDDVFLLAQLRDGSIIRVDPAA